jgi:hypothetical protein
MMIKPYEYHHPSDFTVYRRHAGIHAIYLQNHGNEVASDRIPAAVFSNSPARRTHPSHSASSGHHVRQPAACSLPTATPSAEPAHNALTCNNDTQKNDLAL